MRCNTKASTKVMMPFLKGIKLCSNNYMFMYNTGINTRFQICHIHIKCLTPKLLKSILDIIIMYFACLASIYKYNITE